MSSNAALNKFAKGKQKFDLVFLDPPYAKQKIATDMAKMVDLELLNNGSVVVAETDDQTALKTISSFQLIKEKHLGKTIVRFYRKE